MKQKSINLLCILLIIILITVLVGYSIMNKEYYFRPECCDTVPFSCFTPYHASKCY